MAPYDMAHLVRQDASKLLGTFGAVQQPRENNYAATRCGKGVHHLMPRHGHSERIRIVGQSSGETRHEIVDGACARVVEKNLACPLYSGDGNGLCLFTKRLDQGGFTWPQVDDRGGQVVLSSAQLSLLLEGIDWRAPERVWRPAAAG